MAVRPPAQGKPGERMSKTQSVKGKTKEFATG